MLFKGTALPSSPCSWFPDCKKKTISITIRNVKKNIPHLCIVYQGCVKSRLRTDFKKLQKVFSCKNLSTTSQEWKWECAGEYKGDSSFNKNRLMHSPCLCKGHSQARIQTKCTHSLTSEDNQLLCSSRLRPGGSLTSQDLLRAKEASTPGWVGSGAGSEEQVEGGVTTGDGEKTSTSSSVVYATYFQCIQHALVFEGLIEPFPQLVRWQRLILGREHLRQVVLTEEKPAEFTRRARVETGSYQMLYYSHI